MDANDFLLKMRQIDSRIDSWLFEPIEKQALRAVLAYIVREHPEMEHYRDSKMDDVRDRKPYGFTMHYLRNKTDQKYVAFYREGFNVRVHPDLSITTLPSSTKEELIKVPAEELFSYYQANAMVEKIRFK